MGNLDLVLGFLHIVQLSFYWVRDIAPKKNFPDGKINDFCKTDALMKEVKRVLIKL